MENLIDMLNASGRVAVNDKLYKIYWNLRRANYVLFQLTEQVFAQLGKSPPARASGSKSRPGEVRAV
jgi:hypothetical protein